MRTSRVEALERLARGLLSDVRGAGLAEVARGVAPDDATRARSLAHEAVALIAKSGSGAVTSSGRLVAAQVMSGTDAVPHALALAELAVLSLEGKTLETRAIARGLRVLGEWPDIEHARPWAKRLLARLPVQNLPGVVQSIGVREGLVRLDLFEQVVESLRGSIEGPYLGSVEPLLAWQRLRPEDAAVALARLPQCDGLDLANALLVASLLDLAPEDARARCVHWASGEESELAYAVRLGDLRRGLREGRVSKVEASAFLESVVQGWPDSGIARRGAVGTLRAVVASGRCPEDALQVLTREALALRAWDPLAESELIGAACASRSPLLGRPVLEELVARAERLVRDRIGGWWLGFEALEEIAAAIDAAGPAPGLFEELIEETLDGLSTLYGSPREPGMFFAARALTGMAVIADRRGGQHKARAWRDGSSRLAARMRTLDRLSLGHVHARAAAQSPAALDHALEILTPLADQLGSGILGGDVMSLLAELVDAVLDTRA